MNLQRHLVWLKSKLLSLHSPYLIAQKSESILGKLGLLGGLQTYSRLKSSKKDLTYLCYIHYSVMLKVFWAEKMAPGTFGFFDNFWRLLVNLGA